MQKAGQPFRFALMLRIKPGRVVPTERSDWGNTRQARIACEIPLPLGFLKNGCLASEARQAEGEAARGQLGWEKGHVVKPGVLQACPHVPPDPSCPSACTGTVVMHSRFWLFGGGGAPRH